MEKLKLAGNFKLESGEILQDLEIGYHSYGSLNADASNVIWICHALTANSDPQDWWPGMIGKDMVFDPSRYFIVCANILGSCYGTTGPLSNDPSTGKPYFHSFPFITIRDMVRAHQLLAGHLGIHQIHILVGGSMGGYQAIEWAVMEPGFIKQLFLISTSARETAWGIAIHTAQRMAIEADQTWNTSAWNAGESGMKAARAFGMITYRSFENYQVSQTDAVDNKTDHFKASSYIQYQGEKIVSRFNAFSYWCLSKAMDSHNISRGRGRYNEEILQQLKQRTLVIGITTDILSPLQEQQFLAEHIPGSTFHQVYSIYGHDGFLVETGKISEHLRVWLNLNSIKNETTASNY
jgi:homoserine O-acetyltransferase/O-succinyltransferase